MNALTTRHQMHSAAYSTEALTVELAKMLALVAPTSMTTQQQELWLRAAVDALEDIRADEVVAISAEVRRSVTHPSKIVPLIAELVAERRQAAEKERARQVRAEHTPALAPIPPRPPAAPLSRFELDTMNPQTASLGLKYGFLERVDGKLVEVG